jgi:hypothetical protein
MPSSGVLDLPKYTYIEPESDHIGYTRVSQEHLTVIYILSQSIVFLFFFILNIMYQPESFVNMGNSKTSRESLAAG